MKICYVTSRYPSLSETFIAREMQWLVDLGHEITICQLKWSTPWRSQQGLQVSPAYVLSPQFGPLPWAKGLAWGLCRKGNPLRSIWQEYRQTSGEAKSKLKLLAILLTVLRLAQCLDGNGIGHVRAHFLHGEAVGAMWLARLLNAPYSITAHTLAIYFPRSIIEKTVRAASFCAAITNETLELLTDLRGTSEAVHLIRNGISLREFMVNSAVSWNSRPPQITAVGRLVSKKGFDLLIRACSLLRDWDIDFTCKIIGDGPQYATLNRLITELDLGGYVSLVGALPFEEVKCHYQRASIVVMPSRISSDGQDRDGLPTVIIEALAMGVPVVATTLAGIPDLIIHNQTGLLVPCDNPTELATAIRRILEDENLRDCLAQAGREKVAREFDMAESARRLESRFYKK
jgi:colanic acid/amylovoran biosynthesis glycosyltransferase